MTDPKTADSMTAKWSLRPFRLKLGVAIALAVVATAPFPVAAQARRSHRHTMSYAKGKAALRQFAGRVANQTAADRYILADCTHNSQRVFCTIQWDYDADGQICDAQFNAYYVGDLIKVKEDTQVGCTPTSFGP
jgi:hypothetical protein